MKLKATTLGCLTALAGAFAVLHPTAQAAELNVYAWNGELPEEVVQDFAEETGVAVTFDVYDSNESMMAKLEAGAIGYDIIQPSQYAVQILMKKGLLAPIDRAKIPNLSNLGSFFQTVSYDPGNAYSVPSVWGTTGLAYNTDCVKDPITSWTALWSDQYKGRIYMLDNMLAAYIAALQINGYHASTSDPAEIAKATESLIAQKSLLAGYNSSNFADLVSSGEACIVEAWSGNVLQVIADNPKVKFVLPDEGGTMFIENYAIVKSAKNIDVAHQFIDYMLRPDVAAKITRLTRMANAVDASKRLLPPEIVENPAIYPPAEKLAKADFILDTGEAMKFYQEGWTKVKAAQ